MKKIFILLTAFLAVSWASAQTKPTTTTTTPKRQVDRQTLEDKKFGDTVTVDKTRQSTTTNPDGSKKVKKTYEGTTKPNTNGTKNNPTGSPDYPRKPTDTLTTPGTVNPSRTKTPNTTTPDPTTVPNPGGSTTIPPR